MIHHRKVMLEVTGSKRELNITGWVPGVASDSTEVRVIAVKGAVDDWAAYCGHAAIMDADEVQRSGSKLDADTAAFIFPLLDARRYRR